MQIFDVIIFFKLRTIQQKTVKPTYLCPLEKDDYIENLHVLSCFVFLKSVLLISCVFWIFFFFLFFSERWQSTLFQMFQHHNRKIFSSGSLIMLSSIPPNILLSGGRSFLQYVHAGSDREVTLSFKTSKPQLTSLISALI